MLRLRPDPTCRVRALLIAQHRDTGAFVRRLVTCTVPLDLFAKAGSAFGRVYSDAQGSFRWITVHPRGEDEKGTPVKIRESKTERGVWHVVGGAGGKLNYLKLTGVKTPEEYSEQQKAKKAAQKEKGRAEAETKAQRQAKLTEEELKIEAEQERAKEETREKARIEMRTRQQKYIADVAEELGWKDEEWQFEATRARLTESGADAKRIDKIEEQHHLMLLRKADAVVEASKRQVLFDGERAVEAVHGMPLTTDDPEKLGLTDILDRPSPPRGKGFESVTRESSDDEIRAALAAADKERLRAELVTAEARMKAQAGGDDVVTPDIATTRAKVEDLKGQLRTAELLERASRLSPEDIADEREQFDEATRALAAEENAYAGRLSELRLKEGQQKIGRKERRELSALEERAAEGAQRKDALRERAADLEVIEGAGVGRAVGGEKATVATRHQLRREAEIRAEHGDEGVRRYRAMVEMMRNGAAKYRAEMRHYRETGAIRKPELESKLVVSPEKVLGLLAQRKALAAMGRQVARAEEKDKEIDLAIFGKGYFTDVGTPSTEAIAAAEADVHSQVIEKKTRAFLDRVESPELLLGRGGQYSDDMTERTLHQALERHLGAGSYNALNNAAMAAVKTPLLNRDVVDTLGAAGAAQLMAHVLAEHEDPGTLREMAVELGKHHVAENVEQAEERLREVEDALDAADEALASIETPADLALAVEANRRRQQSLEQARQIAGQALGEYEATAALVKALGEGKRDSIHVNFGPIGAETAIRQLRALGLGREDYEINSDGTNYMATIAPSGFSKLTKPVDVERMRLVDDVLAIKRGERDDPAWEPKGTIVRPATSLQAAPREPASLTGHLKPFGNFGDSGDVAADIEEHVALRAANGDEPNDILADLHGAILGIPEAHRASAAEAVAKIFPVMTPLVENGKPIMRQDKQGNAVPKMVYTKAEQHSDAVHRVVDGYFKRAGLERTSALHAQGVEEDSPHIPEVLTRALAQDPRAMVAFSPLGDLTSQDQRALRHYFDTEVAKGDVASGFDKASVDREIAALGPEPPRTSKGLFGTEETTAEWRGWKGKRDAIVAAAHGSADEGSERTSAWQEYVLAMGGTSGAYQALQDRLKSTFLREFHRSYTTLADKPLRIGVRPIEHSDLHEGYLDPAKRAERLAERRRLIDEARHRLRGKYAAGSALEKMERLAQANEIARQNQLGLLGATPTAASRREPAAHERYTLGQRIEGQIARLMPQVARNFRPGEPVKLMADKRWVDPPGNPPRFVHQQRTIKQFERTKRLAVALGTGSGKTSIGIGALAHLRSQPGTGVKRGVFVVPSSVQGQFGGEFARFVKPGAMNWSANPGGDREQRLAEHRDPSNHAVVHTHQSFRDDMLHLVAEHWGVAPDEAKKRFMALDRKGAAAALKEAWKKHGVDYQFMMVDEGHGLLDRAGKVDSLLSRVAQAASDNTPYYMSATADVVKNDVSELRSLLDKLEPSGRYSDAGEWNRRYGINTTAAAEALKREVSPYVYAGQIPGGHGVAKRVETVSLHPEQKKRYAAILSAFGHLQAARERGEVDVAAAKELAPARFEGKPETEHQEIARTIQRNPGVYREQALGHVVDRMPREHNAKIQKLVELLKDHPVKEKPVVVFAHNLSAVDDITEALAEAGHRVQKLTGADSAAERDRKRLRFQPETGEPDVDVFVLSDAGQAGLNLQRGQTLVQYDTPMTAMGHAQRNGRIDRLGQKQDVDLINLASDTPYEAAARARVEKKYVLRDIVTDPASALDETGMAQAFGEARRRAETQRGRREAA